MFFFSKATQNQRNTNTGFTLVELLVSLGVFTIVMTIGVGSVLTTIDANRRSQAAQAVLNNLDAAMEDMTRKITTGSRYHCYDSAGSITADETPRSCAGSGGPAIALEGEVGAMGDPDDQVLYRYDASKQSIERAVSSDASGPVWQRLTAPDIVVEELTFYVLDAELPTGNLEQARVLIIVRGYGDAGKGDRFDFDLQTFATQRQLDVI